MRAALVTLLLITLAPRIARAEEKPPPVAWSFAAGLAMALVPMAIGGGIVASASNTDDAERRRAGVHVIGAGLALAPWVSHLIAREWKRAAVFGSVAVALFGGVVAVFEGYDIAHDGGNYGSRFVFGAALALELVAAGVGLADSLLAGDRWRARHPVIMPMALPSGGGVSIGGLW
jgi:hypothetical protein